MKWFRSSRQELLAEDSTPEVRVSRRRTAGAPHEEVSTLTLLKGTVARDLWGFSPRKNEGNSDSNAETVRNFC